MGEIPKAECLTLRKIKPLAPAFHRHIARSKLLGKTCSAGDTILVYEIIATVPEGTVTVTEETVFQFE
jgi:hypothetical protein